MRKIFVRIYLAFLVACFFAWSSLKLRTHLENQKADEALHFALEKIQMAGDHDKQKYLGYFYSKPIDALRGDFLVIYAKPPFVDLKWTVNLPQGLLISWQSKKREGSLLQ